MFRKLLDTFTADPVERVLGDLRYLAERLDNVAEAQNTKANYNRNAATTARQLAEEEAQRLDHVALQQEDTARRAQERSQAIRKVFG